MSGGLCCYNKQHSKLLAQFAFKTRTKTPMPLTTIHNALIRFTTNSQHMQMRFIDVLDMPFVNLLLYYWAIWPPKCAWETEV